MYTLQYSLKFIVPMPKQCQLFEIDCTHFEQICKKIDFMLHVQVPDSVIKYNMLQYAFALPPI